MILLYMCQHHYEKVKSVTDETTSFFLSLMTIVVFSTKSIFYHLYVPHKYLSLKPTPILWKFLSGKFLVRFCKFSKQCIMFINKAATSNMYFYTINFHLCQWYIFFSSLTFKLWMEIIQNLFYSIYIVLPFSPWYHHKQYAAHEARNEYQPKDRSQHRRYHDWGGVWCSKYMFCNQ